VWGSRGVSGENGAVLRGGGVLRPAQPGGCSVAESEHKQPPPRGVFLGFSGIRYGGAEAFLERMAQFFEVVVFSDQLNLSVDPILDRLDQKGCIRYRLYRDGTLYTDGNYVR
ncbi:unnamed protein product, partial [Closterium sp. NIES-54]